MRTAKDQRQHLNEVLKQQQQVLEHASGMSRQEATKSLFESLERELEADGLELYFKRTAVGDGRGR